MKYLILKKLRGKDLGYTFIVNAKNKREARKKAKNSKGKIKSVTCLD